MRARVEVVYVADNPDEWERVYGDSDPKAEFLSFVRDSASNIGGGVSVDRIDVWGESDVVLKTIPGARWEGLDQAITVGDDDDGHDPVNHPSHYTSHPSGVEIIELTEGMGFCLGNAVKYLSRAPYKGSHREDLRKCVWCLKREIDRRERGILLQSRVDERREATFNRWYDGEPDEALANAVAEMWYADSGQGGTLDIRSAIVYVEGEIERLTSDEADE